MTTIVSAAAQRLRVALALTTGAALIGWNRAVAYLAGTVGWALKLAGLNPYHFGAVGDGIDDDTAAVQAWAAYTDGPRVGAPGVFRVTQEINLGTSPNIDGRGMVIDASGGGAFANSSVLYVSGALSALPALSVSPAARDQALTFAAAHALAEDDVFLIYNPTNSSFNAARTYYRAGEWCQVLAVTGAQTVKLWTALYAGYAAGTVTVHKLAPNAVHLSNITIKAPGAGSIRPLRVRLATRARLDRITASGSDYCGVELDRCFDVETTGCTLGVQPQVYNDEYAITIGNSQNVRIIGGMLSASRHAVSIGGDDVTGCVPNRNIRVIGATLRNDPASAAPAADVHGNCEDVEYIDCTIYGGASFGGKDVTYRGCTLNGAPLANGALIVGGSECMGGRYVVEGCNLVATAAYAYGVIRGSNGAAATVADSHLIVSDCTVDMGPCDVFARFDMGSTAKKANADVQGVTFLASTALANILRMVGTGAAGDGDYIVVDGITNAKAGATLYTAANGYGATVKARLMRQDGAADLVLTSASPLSSVSPTFRLSYGSKTPTVQLSINTRIVGANPLAVAWRLKTAAGFTADVYTTNNANAGATPTVRVEYSAGLSEI